VTILDVITALASTATAVGVIIAVIQLFHAEKLAKSQFEDQFRRDYREICDHRVRFPKLHGICGPEVLSQTLSSLLSSKHGSISIQRQQFTD